MGVVLYNIVLAVFLIPVTIRAYLSLKKGRYPLPYFQNNVVINRIKLRKAIGVLSPILFWAFHALWLMWNVSIDAWLAVLVTAAYMVVSPMLSAQIKAKQVGVISETLGAGTSDNEHA